MPSPGIAFEPANVRSITPFVNPNAATIARPDGSVVPYASATATPKAAAATVSTPSSVTHALVLKARASPASAPCSAAMTIPSRTAISTASGSTNRATERPSGGARRPSARRPTASGNTAPAKLTARTSFATGASGKTANEASSAPGRSSQNSRRPSPTLSANRGYLQASPNSSAHATPGTAVETLTAEMS